MMDLLDMVVVVFFYILPLFIPAIVVPKQLQKLPSQNHNLVKIIVVSSLAILIPILLLYIGNYIFPFIPGFPYFAFLLPPSAAVWGLLPKLFIARRRLKPEDILLDLGRIENKLYILFGLGIGFFIFFIVAMGIVTAFYTESIYDERFGLFFPVIWILTISSGFLGAGLNLMIGLSKVYITQDGFSRFRLESLKWEDIQAYQWRSADDEKIELKLMTKYEINFNIPVKYQAQVDKILKEKVGLELPDQYYYRIPERAGG